MGRFGGAAAALVLGFWSYASFVTFVGGRLNARLGASEGPRCRQLRGAVGHFPAREALEVSPPGRQTVLERLQAELPASNVEEHTEEVRLLRDQTALLAQDLNECQDKGNIRVPKWSPGPDELDHTMLIASQTIRIRFGFRLGFLLPACGPLGV